MTLRVTVSAVLAGAAQLRLLSPPAGNMAYVLNHALKMAARLFIYCELSLCSSHIEINSEDNLNPFHSIPHPLATASQPAQPSCTLKVLPREMDLAEIRLIQ